MVRDTLTQDNDTWQTLAAATARALQRTQEKDVENSEEGNPESAAEEQRAREARYLEQRRRDFERFESLVRGTIAPRRKRSY